MSEANVTRDSQELEEIKKVLIELTVELVHKLERLRRGLITLSIEGIVAKESVIRSIIQVKKILDQFPDGSSKNKFIASPYHLMLNKWNASSSFRLDHIGAKKLINFYYASEYTIWECSNKLLLLKKFITMTREMKKALAIAQTIHKIKQILSSSKIEDLRVIEDENDSEEDASEEEEEEEEEEVEENSDIDLNKFKKRTYTNNETKQEVDAKRKSTDSIEDKRVRFSDSIEVGKVPVSKVDQVPKESAKEDIEKAPVKDEPEKLTKNSIPDPIEQTSNEMPQIGTSTRVKKSDKKLDELSKAIDAVLMEIESSFNNYKGNLFLQEQSIQNASHSRLNNILHSIRCLKEIRQLIINYDESYKYPSVQELKLATNKMNFLHQTGQGKLAIIQELGLNTMNEISGNLSRFRKSVNESEDLDKLLKFARLLRMIHRNFEKLKLINSTSSVLSKSQNVKEKLITLQELLKDEPQQILSAEEQNFADLHQKVSYFYTTTHLLRLTIQHLDNTARQATKERATELQAFHEEDVTKFLDNYASHVFGENLEAFEDITEILRNDPQILVRLTRNLSYQKLDEFVGVMSTSLFSDIFLSREDIWVLKLIQNFILGTDLSKIKSAGEMLRESSLVTKLLSSYTKRQSSKTYLAAVLNEPITSLLSLDECTEMDPVLLYQMLHRGDTTYIDRQSASRDPQVKAMLVKHHLRLQKYCSFFFERITATVSTMPFGIRFIAKTLAQCVAKRFPGSDDELNLLLGSFIFLHYFSPAIISPEIFGTTVATKFTPNQRRTLVLITKVLQSMANDKVFQNKESWLEPMNPWIVATRPRLTSYYRSLIRITDQPEAFLGCLESPPLGNMRRSLIMSPKDMYYLWNLIRENENELKGTEHYGMLRQLLSEIGNINGEDNIYSSPAPVLLKVPIEPITASKTSSSDILASVKVKFRKFLVGANLANVSPTETLLQIFEGLQKSCNNEEDEETILDILETLVSLSPEYQNQNFATFLSEIENDYWQRIRAYEYLLMEKIEILQAIERLKKEVSSLTEMKMVYIDYLEQKAAKTNASFQEWLKTRSEGRDSLVLAYLNSTYN